MISVPRKIGPFSAIFLIAVGLAGPATAQSGLLSGLGDIVDELLDIPGAILEIPGEILQGGGGGSPSAGGGGGGGGGGGAGGGVLGQNAAIEAVRRQLAIPLDALLTIVAQYTDDPVIDVHLVLVQDVLLLYEVKTLGSGGMVMRYYFLASTGARVQL
jgi:hypothetical protein